MKSEEWFTDAFTDKLSLLYIPEGRSFCHFLVFCDCIKYFFYQETKGNNILISGLGAV